MLPTKSATPDSIYISTDLHNLNCPVHRFGYDHLIVAVKRYARGDMESLSKELYPYVADQFGYTDWRAIERSIRSVIADAWDNRDPRVWALYFPRFLKAPSNKQFIATLAQRLQQNSPPENERG